jgi:uncharacterized protein YbaR (Trm112 family)
MGWFAEKGSWLMDLTRCPKCRKRMKAVATSDGRTGLQCLRCDKADHFQTESAGQADSAPISGQGDVALRENAMEQKVASRI